MPRVRRQISESGYYHVMIRGNARQIIFESEVDRRYFLDLLKKSMEGTSVAVLAWCLMDTHVHLLISDPAQNLSLVMKRLLSQYAHHYNALADRVGHVFQDRFLSIPVETDHYLLEAVRYIHRNPVRGCLCANPGDYEWSSYSQYDDPAAFIDRKLLRELIGGTDAYEAFMSKEDETECMEFEPRRHDDEWASSIIRKRLKLNSGTELQSLDRDERNAALRTLKAAGITVRQLERLTGINRGVIQRV